MNANLAQELLNEMGSSLESLEAQHAALLQFLKDKGTVTDKKFAPYLTQAGKASNVRWRAARARLERIISTEKEREEQLAEKEKHQAGAASAPARDQEKEAKSKHDEGVPEAAPQREEAPSDTAEKSGGAQSNAEKDSEKDQPAIGEDKKIEIQAGKE
jgi:hypothetical protein